MLYISMHLQMIHDFHDEPLLKNFILCAGKKIFPSFHFRITRCIYSVGKDGFARHLLNHVRLVLSFPKTIPMPVSAFYVLCCLFPSHFLLLCSNAPGSAADGAWPVGVGRQPALARNFQFQLDLTEGGSYYPYTEVGSEKNTPAVS